MINEMTNPKLFISQASGRRCLVVGDIILDKYVSGSVTRVSPEAPIPVVHVEQEKYVLGGAANVAGNILGYHVKPYLCGILGNDESGRIVMQLLESQHIDFMGMVVSGRCTTTKTRITGMNQQLVRVDQEITDWITLEEETELLDNIKELFDEVQVIILSDYNKGACTERLCREIILMGRSAGKQIIVDPKSADWSKYAMATMITPNFKEFTEVVSYGIRDDEKDIMKAAEVLLKKYELERILVTRSQRGMTLLGGDIPITYAAVQQEVFDVSGAGDTVVGTIASALAAGYGIEDAVEFSNYAAGLSVSKLGTYTVTMEEVLRYINRNGVTIEDKIVDVHDMDVILENWHKEKKKIIFTNGCFDILHAGHIDYLNEAKKLGDKLIVGLNTDRSVRQLKGPTRPINRQMDRAKLLAALQSVDMVVLFDEETPYELINKIHPDVLVKGGDYKMEEVVGRECAEKLCLIPFLEGYSTTDIIERLKEAVIINKHMQ